MDVCSQKHIIFQKIITQPGLSRQLSLTIDNMIFSPDPTRA